MSPTSRWTSPRPEPKGHDVADGSVVPTLSSTPRLFVPEPNPGAIAQLEALRRAGRIADVELLEAMLRVPSSVWFEGGSPADVERDVRALLALTGDTVPVLVAYNVPGRDCAQYSIGGARTGDAYRAWIRGCAEGIGGRRVIVILEPDGLALQPVDCSQPDTFGRARLIREAVDTITATKLCVATAPVTAGGFASAISNVNVASVPFRPVTFTVCGPGAALSMMNCPS